MLPAFVAVHGEMTVADLVGKLLEERTSSREFYDDVIVHQDGLFLGLASIKQLIVKQMDLIRQQMTDLQKQQTALTQKNQELVQSALRLSADQNQRQAVFEACSVPIAIFDQEGRLLEANPRFQQLCGYRLEELNNPGSSQLLFGEDLKNVAGVWPHPGTEPHARKPTHILGLRPLEGPDLGLEVSLAWNQAGAQMILSVLRVLEEEEKNVHDQILQRIASESDLVKSVFSAQIDRESHSGSALQKMERLVKYARALEQKDLAEEPAASNTPDLRGTLGELSIIDLAQLLIHGQKTGRLTVTGTEGQDCQVFFERGKIVHAQSQGLEGKIVLTKVMALTHGSFVFNCDLAPPAQTIEGDPIGLLMDACVEVDLALV
jgi:hypothetical protein